MKRIFIITGANGFLGNNIVRKLTENAENEVRALVLPGDVPESKYYKSVVNKEYDNIAKKALNI